MIIALDRFVGPIVECRTTMDENNLNKGLDFVRQIVADDKKSVANIY